MWLIGFEKPCIYSVPIKKQSYVKYFGLGEWIKYDSDKVRREFEEDTVPKMFYYAKTLKKNKSNMLTASQFNAKLEKHELNPEEYLSNNVTLRYDAGIQHTEWEDNTYSFDFYEGVLVAKSHVDIKEFLVLWQYLKSEMLILEVPQECSKETLGLFFTRTENELHKLSVNEQIEHINFYDFTYSDRHYLGSATFELSYEFCIMYKEYLSKKMYASTTLDLFIRKGFRTTEERIQNSALAAAWLAIGVSILLTFAPLVRQNEADVARTQAVERIEQEVIEFSALFENYVQTIEKNSNAQTLVDKLDTIINSLSSDGNSEEIPQQEPRATTPEN